jgi:hypothetical protein
MLDNKEVQAGAEAPKSTGRKLGISKDIQAKAGIPIGAPVKLDKRTEQYPNGYEFPLARLVKVHCDPAKEIKRQSGDIDITPILSFTFATDKGKTFTHVEFPIDSEETDEIFNKKLEEMQQKIMHIFDETIGHSYFEEGSMEGEDFVTFFKNVAIAFNAKTVTKGEGETAKTNPFFTMSLVYLKLSYYKERAQLPKFPNFIQKAYHGNNLIPCELVINAKWDKLEPTAQENKPTTQYSGGNNATFGGGDFGGLPDFPTLPSM